MLGACHSKDDSDLRRVQIKCRMLRGLKELLRASSTRVGPASSPDLCQKATKCPSIHLNIANSSLLDCSRNGGTFSVIGGCFP